MFCSSPPCMILIEMAVAPIQMAVVDSPQSAISSNHSRASLSPHQSPASSSDPVQQQQEAVRESTTEDNNRSPLHGKKRASTERSSEQENATSSTTTLPNEPASTPPRKKGNTRITRKGLGETIRDFVRSNRARESVVKELTGRHIDPKATKADRERLSASRRADKRAAKLKSHRQKPKPTTNDAPREDEIEFADDEDDRFIKDLEDDLQSFCSQTEAGLTSL